MSRKTLVFVDGQNLFYSLRDMGIQEVQVKWDSFFNALLEPGDELIRAYWYQAQKFAGPRLTLENARRHVNPAGKSEDAIDAEALALLVGAQQWTSDQNKRHENQLHRYDELSIKYPVIEMVRRGIVRTDPFRKAHIGEKELTLRSRSA